MKQLFEEKIKTLEAVLAASVHEANPLKRISLHAKLVEDTLGEILRDVDFQLQYIFEQAAQIEYSKHYLPPLLSQLLLLKKTYLLENQKLYSTSEGSKLYCKQELEKVQQFFDTHKDFCQYYYSGQSDEDWQLFTAANCAPYPVLNEFRFPFNVGPGCLLATKLLVNEQYGKLLRDELDGVTGLLESSADDLKIIFNGTETEAVELSLAFHAADFILVDGKPATQEFLIGFTRKLFGLPLKNWQQLAQKIRARKFADLKALTRLSEHLSARNKRLLDGKRSQKRLNSK